MRSTFVLLIRDILAPPFKMLLYVQHALGHDTRDLCKLMRDCQAGLQGRVLVLQIDVA